MGSGMMPSGPNMSMAGGSPMGPNMGMGMGGGPMMNPPMPQLPPPNFEVPISIMHVRVNQATKLKNKDTGLFGDYSDAYVVVNLGSQEFKTSVIDNNLNPVWSSDNYFTFEVAVEATTLKLACMNKNRFKDDSLGETEVDVRTLARGEWCRFKEKLENGDDAELEFDVFFRPTEFHGLHLDTISLLYIRVNGAHKLINKDTGLFGDVSDPFVKVKVGQAEKRTPTIDNDLNPKWEEGNQFTFVLDDSETAIQVEVLNSNNFKDDSLGHVSVDIHDLEPEEWCSFQRKLEDGDGQIDFQAYLKPTEFQRRRNDAQKRKSQEGGLGKKAADLAQQIKEAEYSCEWLEDIAGKTRLPMSVEEKDWEHACGGRNLVVPAWIMVTQTQVAALQRSQQQKRHPVALFPEEAAQEGPAKMKVKITSAEGLSSSFCGNYPNAYCVCEIPLKPESTVKTPFVPANPNPVWRHSRTVKGYKPGDSVVFNVFSMDEDAVNQQAQGGGARQKKRDELLGTAALAGDRFFPDGFDGLLNLNLTLTGRQTGAALRVTAFVIEAGQG
mmetsp:Transcript_84897/g.243634  ORF Transcript_84897/g.243634 Transcript_84897/m.243634 type:complete len:552 (+) Transcript_84897:2-1657(+)